MKAIQPATNDLQGWGFPNTEEPKAPESKPDAQPDGKDDLKTLPLAEVEKKLGSSPDGLSQAEAQKRPRLKSRVPSTR
jgi:hypothetical protein